jgi:hypothetical protein
MIFEPAVTDLLLKRIERAGVYRRKYRGVKKLGCGVMSQLAPVDMQE